VTHSEIQARNCENCGKILDFSAGAYKGILEDDVVSAGFVSDDGADLCCSCFKSAQEAAEEEYWEDPAGADGLP